MSDNRWIYAKEITELLDISYDYFTEKVCTRQDFPRPFRLTPNGKRRWLRAEIMAWLEGKRDAA
jgi:predicted DNA-binding transcriptional regulator AlpA